MRGLLLGHDNAVAAWAFQAYQFKPTPIDAAIGIMEPDGTLAGAALFQRFNGHDVELSYYGSRTLTPGIVRSIAKTALDMNVQRITVTTAKSNRKFVKSILRLGFIHECAKHRYYGHRDDLPQHCGMQMVMFRKRIEEVANRTGPAVMPLGKDKRFMKKHKRRRK